MSKYRKKPVVIEAFQMTRKRRQDNSEWPTWLNEAWQKERNENGALISQDCPDSDGTDPLFIVTLEGLMAIGWDDWIIQGVKGELYPCKPDIFAATYEAVEPRFTAEDQKELEDGVIAEIDEQNAHIEKTGELQGPGMTEKEKVLAKTLIQVHVLTRGYGAKMWAGVLNLIEHNGADAILSEYADEQYTGSIEKLTQLQENDNVHDNDREK